MMKQNNGGFTLVEFVVTIAIASMITLAATTMLLLGLRIHHKSNIIAAQQNTVLMLYSVMDTIASENEIKEAPSNDDFNKADNNSWEIETEGTKIEYKVDTGIITLNETTFLSNVAFSNANLDKSNGLLTVVIITEHNEYSFSVYCRKGVDTTE